MVAQMKPRQSRGHFSRLSENPLCIKGNLEEAEK
jgi:hypothetical protein